MRDSVVVGGTGQGLELSAVGRGRRRLGLVQRRRRRSRERRRRLGGETSGRFRRVHGDEALKHDRAHVEWYGLSLKTDVGFTWAALFVSLLEARFLAEKSNDPCKKRGLGKTWRVQPENLTVG